VLPPIAKANAREFETTSNLMGVLQNTVRYVLANNYFSEQQEILNSLTLKQADETIIKYVDTNKLSYLVVGDPFAKTNATNKP
jgi:zinc protease